MHTDGPQGAMLVLLAVLAEVGALSEAQHAKAREVVGALDPTLTIPNAVKLAHSKHGLQAAVKLDRIAAARRQYIAGELEVGEFERVLDGNLPTELLDGLHP